MSNQEIIARIETLDADRVRATLAADIPTLERLLAEDMRYVHSNAADEDRALYLQRLRDRYYDYKGIDLERRDCRVLGDVVLVNGDVRLDVEVQGTAKQIRSRYLQVWTQRDGRWQMVSYHSTPIPA